MSNIHLTDIIECFEEYGMGNADFTCISNKIESGQYDVVLEPSYFCWLEMTKVWPKTKFVQVTRDADEWVESFHNYFSPLHDIMMDNFDVFVYRNPHIFPRSHAKLELLSTLMTESIGLAFNHYFRSKEHTANRVDYKWKHCLYRRYRMFHADVAMNGPGTMLRNFSVKARASCVL